MALTADGTYNYIVSAQKPTIVNHSITCNFTSPTDFNLIISKCNQLEILTMTPSGLLPVMNVPLYGRIASLKSYRPKNSKLDYLFLLFERYSFSVLSFNEQNHITTIANGDLNDPIGRHAEHVKALIDTGLKVIVCHLYDGLLKILPFTHDQSLSEAYNVRIDELNIIEFCSLYSSSDPYFAIIYQDAHDRRFLKIYLLDLKSKELKNIGSQSIDQDSCLLIPLKPSSTIPEMSLLIVSSGSITYYHHTTSELKIIPIQELLFLSYGVIDENRFLLSDCHGYLHIVVLIFENQNLSSVYLETLGHASSANTLTYLDNGVVFVGSCRGDSQLIRLLPNPSPQNTYLEILESFPNTGPIVDMAVIDLNRQGQGQIICCSGVAQDGSLRIIRNGIGIHENASLSVQGIKGLWASKPLSSLYHQLLVIAFISETRFLSFNIDNELEEVTIPSLQSNCQTLYFADCLDSCWIQITSSQVTIANQYKIISSWSSTDPISMAHSSGQYIAVVSGNKVILLLLEDNGEIKYINETLFPQEVSCIYLSHECSLLAVSLWTDISIHLLSISSLKSLHIENVSSKTIFRSLIIIRFDQSYYIIGGSGDGHCFCWTLSLVDQKYQLNDFTGICLGSQPILLSQFTHHNTLHVFATSDSPAIIYAQVDYRN